MSDIPPNKDYVVIGNKEYVVIDIHKLHRERRIEVQCRLRTAARDAKIITLILLMVVLFSCVYYGS